MRPHEIREACLGGAQYISKSYCFPHIIFIGTTCLLSDFPYGGGCLNQAQTLRDWLTFAWYIKFVPGEARIPRLNKSSDVLSVYRHLTGGLAHAGDAIWLMSDDTKEDSGSLEPATAKRHISPTHPLPSRSTGSSHLL